jgi:glycosyltransferase involved in cell wall biosynthesis
MKVLLVLDRPNLYGSELHFLDLADYFNNQANINVLVLRDGPLLERMQQLKIPYTIMYTGWFPSLHFLVELRRKVKQFSPDIIHSHQPKANMLMAIVRIFYRARFVATIHSHALDHSLVHRNGFKRKAVYLFHRAIQFFTEAVADKIVYVTHASTATCFFKRKVIVSHNWLNKIISNRLPKDVKVKKDNTIRIISVGSVTYAKGYDLLIDFISLFADQPYEMNIVGSDCNQFADDLKMTIKNKKLKNVFFHHYQSDVSAFFSSNDYFVLFSRSETFGLSYIEAMAYGLPVFALDYETMHEIIPTSNSISNDLQAHKDFLLHLNANPEEYKRVSALNQSYSRDTYSYASAMNRYKGLYDRLLY